MSNPPDLPPRPPNQGSHAHPGGGEVIAYAQPTYNLPFRDRRGGLVGFGVILIILGSLAGCFTLGSAGGVVAAVVLPQARAAGIATGSFAVMMLAAMLLYAAVTAAFFWTGIASIKHQRWVRPVIIVASWVLIAGTVLSALNYLILLPQQLRATQTLAAAPRVVAPVPVTQPSAPGANAGATTTTGQTTITVATPMPPGPLVGGAALVGMIFGFVIMLALGLGLPVLFLWFYGNADTRLTLEHFDQKVRWTDGIPLPVLGIALLAFAAACSLPITVIQMAAGAIRESSLTVWLLLIYASALIPVLLVTAWLCYRLRLAGWVLAVCVVLVGGGVWTAIALFGDLMAPGSPFVVTEAQRQMLREMAESQRTAQVVFGLTSTIAGMAYLIWARRYFIAAPATAG